MAKEKSSPYPATTWDECKSLLRRFDSLGVSLVSTDELAKEYGLSSSRTKSFQYRLSTAKQYGLIDIRNQTVSLTELGQDILHPIEEDIRHLELQCFANPPLHKALLQKFDTKPVPRRDLFENMLVKEFGIAEGAKKRAAECFISTATQMGIIEGGVFCYEKAAEGSAEEPEGKTQANADETAASVSRNQEPLAASGANGAARTTPPRDSSDGAIVQRIPLASGGTLEFSIPVTATADELLLARDIFDILLKRRFGMDKP